MKTGVAGLKWYVAKIVYQVLVGNGTHTAQFDEQYRLIRADEVSWAWEKAQVLGRLGESTFDNNAGEKVQWKYINVSDVCAISENRRRRANICAHRRALQCRRIYRTYARQGRPPLKT
ncbi:MAG: DUF4288 domain-containing protein [Bacteroidia bacterium]|nr:DUF4288 domain-containing protein [Bacteroidia bacterium]